MDDFEKLWDRITLDDVVDKITVPYLITHGVNDRQIPVADAHRSYEQAAQRANPRR
jgi:esterase/lipase